MDQIKYWNSVADTKEFTTPFQIDELPNYIDKHAVILDVGCGYGRTLNELKNQGYENLLGIDYSFCSLNMHYFRL